VVTGKPLDIGGSLGRAEATGRGVTITTHEVLQKMGLKIDQSTVAIQGMGNVGSTSAKLLRQAGARIVSVSDVSGGLYQPEGLDLDSIFKYLSTRGNLLMDYHADGVSHISNEELLTSDVDVLVPAALENQITEQVAERIRAKVIVEGANGPTTVAADEILEKRGIIVVPDILANAGGVVVSYFEWVQNIQSLLWDEDEVNQTLNRIMIAAIDEVYALHLEKQVTLRTAAYAVALRKLVRAKNIRGIFP